MRTKEKHTGICLLCKLHKELTFEHIPPKVAFNKNTRYYVIPHEEYYTIKNIFEDKKKGIIHQGGMGNYCLCTKCNSFLGKSYVRSYETWANIGMHVNHSFDFDFILLRIKDLNPLRILKQIISMFICINNTDFSNLYPELLAFVKDVKENKLSDRYRIYAYLNNEGNIRKFGLSFTNFHGIICEFAYPPFGYVLSIDNKNTLDNLTEITDFKHYDDNRNHIIDIGLFKHPTYYAIPLDFRKREEFEKLYARQKFQ